YIYMYPGNRREPTAAPPPEQPDAPGAPRPATPIGDTLDFLSGAIGTASEYELHNVLRYNLWNAGTPQLAVAVADILARSATREPESTPERDEQRAATLAGLVAARPLNRARVASAMSAASRVLERIASQEAAGSRDLQSASLVAYADLRQTVLAAVIAVCGNGSAGPSGTCGPSERELLIQARELQNDVRNERQLMLSRRFSPIAGTHIGHFGAFLDRPFRDYDYHAGVYDALWSVAEMSCEIRQAQVEGTRKGEVQQSPVQQAPEPAPAGREDPETCRRDAFVASRERLGIRPGSTAHEITERLWRAEHEDLVPARGESPIDRTMTALFDAARCAERPREKMCLRDLDLAAFARALDRAGYQAGRDAPFVRWVMDHPEGGWWALPGVFAAGRLLELARAEEMGKLSTGAALAETYLESYVDQHSTSVFVAPSSLPDRGMTRWAGLLFPFAAMSLHPTRRFELGLLRGGIRVGPKADVSGLEKLLPWDLLAELSARVTVRDRRADEDDQGYGLFTRGSTTLHASFAPTLRMGGILWSLGFRAGVPVPVGALESQIPFKDQVNTEVVATFLGDKLRLAVGCNPLQDPPGDDCWRDVYYSFGVNDLAGLVYWTGLNPYKLERLFVPFAAVRVTTGEPSGEIGLVRGGWQPWRFVGIWADASIVVGSETTGNASVAYEADIGTWLRRVGLRGGYPLSIRDDARIEASSLELVLTFAHGIRVAAGAFPFDVADDEIDWTDASYISLGWDPGSLLLTTVRALR
ncbi:MAG TPA: hypothetical protein VNO33_09725, partial [Kofleriaceae bacterium]|nr:hypothetical protein [Kofleriaceae bacterium]